MKTYYVEIQSLINKEVLWHYYLGADSKDQALDTATELFSTEKEYDRIIAETGGGLILVAEEAEEGWKEKYKGEINH